MNENLMKQVLSMEYQKIDSNGFQLVIHAFLMDIQCSNVSGNNLSELVKTTYKMINAVRGIEYHS